MTGSGVSSKRKQSPAYVDEYSLLEGVWLWGAGWGLQCTHRAELEEKSVSRSGRMRKSWKWTRGPRTRGPGWD